MPRNTSSTMLRLIFRTGISVTAITLAGLQTAAAQTADPTNNDPDSITVIGKLEEELPQQIEKYGSRVDVIPSKSIERRSIPDVSQALQLLVPSLSIQPKSGAFDYANISLQG